MKSSPTKSAASSKRQQDLEEPIHDKKNESSGGVVKRVPGNVDMSARSQLVLLTLDKLGVGGLEAWAREINEKLMKLLSDEEANLASFLAAIGVASHATQIARRKNCLEMLGGHELLMSLEAKLKGHVFLSLVEGGSEEEPTQADAIVAWAVRDVFDAVLDMSDRVLDFPRIHRWLEQCMDHPAFVQSRTEYLESLQALDRALPLRILRGATREGGMIDVKAASTDARRAAEVVKRINADYKKKENQRQREEREKAENTAASVPPSVDNKKDNNKKEEEVLKFSLGEKIPCTLDAEEKAKRCVAMLDNISSSRKGSSSSVVVDHEAAQDANVLVKALAARNLTGVPCKNLFLKAKKPRDEKDSCLWLVCAPTDAVVDLKQLQTHLGYKDQLRFSTPEVLLNALDVAPGHVTPFALVNDPKGIVNVALDSSMMEDPNTVLWFHPLVNTKSLAISSNRLLSFIRASGRVPHLVSLKTSSSSEKKKEEQQPLQQQQQEEEMKITLSMTHSHEEAQARLWGQLKELGVNPPPHRENGPFEASERPRGHSTHNLLVKDKKTKQLHMITLRQDRHLDLKVIGEKIGAKELRLAGPADVQTAIGSCRGCVTPLWLFNNVQHSVVLNVDTALLASPNVPLVICAGCDDPKDHTQHNVVEITMNQLVALAMQSPIPLVLE